MTTLFSADTNNPYTKQLAVQPTTAPPPAPSTRQTPRSVGVTRRPLTKDVLFPEKIPTDQIPKNLNNDTFQIEYQDIVETEVEGSKRVFYFSLLPAIESATTFSGENKFRGNAEVPDVKRGIFTRTIIRQLNYPVPSGVPRLQAIAIDSKLMEIVGAFIGTEEINQSLLTSPPSHSLNSIYPTGSNDLTTPQRNPRSTPVSSYQSALLFDRRVVQQGKPVIITIKTSGNLIRVQGVINQFEIHSVRRERTYYKLVIIYTSYGKIRPLSSSTEVASTETSPTETPPTPPTPTVGSITIVRELDGIIDPSNQDILANGFTQEVIDIAKRIEQFIEKEKDNLIENGEINLRLKESEIKQLNNSKITSVSVDIGFVKLDQSSSKNYLWLKVKPN